VLVKQDGIFQSRGRDVPDRDLSGIGKRFLPPIIFFAIAFAIDMLTGQRYSSALGSVAIVASILHLFPGVRLPLAAFGTYAAVWIGFNLVRAIADDMRPGALGLDAVAGWERAVFGGSLPSDTLQSAFFERSSVGIHDAALSIVHGSFFVVPFAMAGIIWWRKRLLFQHWTVATAITFALGVVGFVLLPTSPPWLNDPENVTRVTQVVLAQGLGLSTGDSAFSFEPNHLAAMPSVHVATTVLVALAARQFGRIPALAGGAYALLMTFGVVYLGEHYVLDAVLGWAIALIGWLVASRVVTRKDGRR
jgi:hypothetical protein